MQDLFTGQNPMIGQNLREVRNRLKITQSKLADLSGISVDTISRIEGGADCMSETIAKLSVALGCTTDALMKGTMEVPKSERAEILMRDIELLPAKRKEQVLDTIEALITYYKYR